MKKNLIISLVICIMSLIATNGYAAETIKIGLVVPLTGNIYKTGKTTLKTVSLIVKKYNEAGGILGKQIELVVMDDKCETEFSREVALSMVEADVVGVIGHICSAPTKVALEIYTKNKIITISPSSTETNLALSLKYPYFLRTIPNDYYHSKIAVNYIKDELEIKTLAIYHDATPFGLGFAKSAFELVENDKNLNTVVFKYVDPTSTNLENLLHELKSRDVDAVLYGGYAQGAINLISGLLDENIQIPFIGSDKLKVRRLPDSISKYKSSIYATYIGDVSRYPANIRLSKEYLVEFGTNPYDHFSTTCTAIQVLLDSIKIANSVNSDKVLEVLHANKFNTALGNIWFSDNGDIYGVKLAVYKSFNNKFIETNFNLSIN